VPAGGLTTRSEGWGSLLGWLTKPLNLGYFAALMSVSLPTRLDPWRAARRGAHYSGALGLDALPRLAEAVLGLGDLEGAGRLVRYRLSFERGQGARALVRGRVEAVLLLPCQRCLDAMALPVSLELALGLLGSEGELAALDESLDPVLIEDDEAQPLEWIEDELLLAIPSIPRHASGLCEAPVDGASQGLSDRLDVVEPKANPFAALAALRGREDD